MYPSPVHVLASPHSLQWAAHRDLPLTELLVELISEVKHVIGVLTMTKSASIIVVERGICEPMWRSKAARHGCIAQPYRHSGRLKQRTLL